MTIELADFISKPIGFEHKFKDDKTRDASIRRRSGYH